MDDYEEYLDYVAESRACGYEVESYKEWRGDESAKDKAMEKIQGRIDRDEEDLH